MHVSMPMNMNATTNKPKGKIETFNLFAPKLKDQLRTIRVYLPPNYDKAKDKHYPVLYMHDGQNLFFNRDTAFKNGAWQVHLTLDKFYEQKINEGFIIVGIDSSTKDRTEEMSLLPVQKRYYILTKTSNLGQEYSDFITFTLKDYIDKHYRTKQDETYIGGSSMGGICSLIMALNHPFIYKGALCFTPAGMIHYQHDLKCLFKEKTHEMQINNITFPKLFFMVGGVGLEQVIKPFCDFAIPSLVRLGYEYGNNITYVFKPKYEHNEKAWAKVFPIAFMWMTSK